MKLSKAFNVEVEPVEVAHNPLEKVDPVEVASRFFDALYGAIDGEGVISSFALPSNHAVFFGCGRPGRIEIDAGALLGREHLLFCGTHERGKAHRKGQGL